MTAVEKIIEYCKKQKNIDLNNRLTIWKKGFFKQQNSLKSQKFIILYIHNMYKYI